MKKLLFISILILIGAFILTPLWAGEKEELNARMSSLQWEMQYIQARIPAIQREAQEIQGKLRALEDKGKSEKKD